MGTISIDPIGIEAGDPNFYRYVGNSPTNGTDPDGLESTFVTAAKLYPGEVAKAAKGMFWTGPKEAVGGVYTAARHPIQTAKGLGYAASHPIQTGKAIASDYAEEATHSEGQGALGFELIVTILTAGSGAAANATAKSAKIVDVAADTARIADRLTDAIPNNGAFRLRATNVGSSADTVTARQIGAEIAKNPIASRAYRQVRDRVGADVVLDFGRAPVPGATGRVQNLSRIEIFGRNLDNVQEGVSTFVHESRHLSDIQRGIANPFRPTQLDEFRAFRREFLSTHGRRPTLGERQVIRQEVEQLYPNLPTGR